MRTHWVPTASRNSNHRNPFVVRVDSSRLIGRGISYGAGGGTALGVATACVGSALTVRWLVASPLSIASALILVLILGAFVGSTAGTLGAIVLAPVVVLWLNSACSHRSTTSCVAVVTGVGAFAATAGVLSFAGPLCLVPAIYAGGAAHHLAVWATQPIEVPQS